jgi:two-component system, NarL family, response regulator LiaR
VERPSACRAHEALGDRPLKTVVADEDARVRRLVREVLQTAGIIVVAEGHNGREAVALSLQYRPDVVLMDAKLPRLDGIPATRRILRSRPEQVIVLLTGPGEDELGWLGIYAGAAGFVRKDIDLDTLPRVLRGAAAGEAAVSRVGMKQVIEHFRHMPEPGD